MAEPLIPRLSDDSRRTIWAVADQCAVSGGNFLTNLILLRALLPIEYGTYALILNATLFFNNMQQAFLGYPLCVLGARAVGVQFQRILAGALLGVLLLSLILFGPLLSVIVADLHKSSLIAAALFAMLFWQLQDTSRAGFIAKLEQRRAIVGDAVSYAGQAVLIAMLSFRRRPSLNVIFWTIAGTSLLALAVQSYQTRPLPPPQRTLRPLLQEFWSLGRWNVVANLLGFVTLQVTPWIILMRHGKVQVAGYQAIFQFLAFTNPLLFSVGSLIIATVAKEGGYRTKSVRNYIFLVTGLVGSYLLLLSIAGPLAVRVLYGSQSHYLPYAPLLRIFAAAWSVEVIALLSIWILGGLREPHAVFLVQLSGATAALLIALPLIYWKGLMVTGYAMLLVSSVRAGTSVFLVLRRRGTTAQESRCDESGAEARGTRVRSMVASPLSPQADGPA